MATSWHRIDQALDGRRARTAIIDDRSATRCGGRVGRRHEVYCARVLVEDPDLLARLRRVIRPTFAAVVRAWSPAMLRVARAHVRTDATAEEIVQEAWMGVVRALPGFEGRALLRTWVFHILVNVARRRGRLESRAIWSWPGPRSTRTGSATRRTRTPVTGGPTPHPARGTGTALLAAEFRACADHGTG